MYKRQAYPCPDTIAGSVIFETSACVILFPVGRLQGHPAVGADNVVGSVQHVPVDDDVGIMLLYQADRARMVRLHMVDDEILDGALADKDVYKRQIL